MKSKKQKIRICIFGQAHKCKILIRDTEPIRDMKGRIFAHRVEITKGSFGNNDLKTLKRGIIVSKTEFNKARKYLR